MIFLQSSIFSLDALFSSVFFPDIFPITNTLLTAPDGGGVDEGEFREGFERLGVTLLIGNLDGSLGKVCFFAIVNTVV